MARKVNEVLAEIQKKGESPNRFSKKSFNDVMKAMANDPDYTAKVAVVKDKKLDHTEDVEPAKEFRKFLKRVVEKAGIDKKESEMVMDPAFEIDNVDGLYDFFTAAQYEYMAAGNTFNFPNRERFKGSISINEKAAGKREAEAHNLQTKESMGWWEYSNEPYQALVASSPCPDYLKSRKKLHD